MGMGYHGHSTKHMNRKPISTKEVVRLHWELKYLRNPWTGERHLRHVWERLAARHGFAIEICKSRREVFAAKRSDADTLYVR